MNTATRDRVALYERINANTDLGWVIKTYSCLESLATRTEEQDLRVVAFGNIISRAPIEKIIECWQAYSDSMSEHPNSPFSQEWYHTAKWIEDYIHNGRLL